MSNKRSSSRERGPAAPTRVKPIVAIIGYGMGNIASLHNAFAKVGADVCVAATPAELEPATHIVLPGVGAFPKGMHQLRSLGFEDAVRRLVGQGRLLLGVCLGMQLLATEGEEHERTAGLNLIPGRVVRFNLPGLRVPHIGWNDTVSRRDDSLLGPAGTKACHYYVHSYHLAPVEARDVSLTSDYGGEFVAGVARGNVLGLQFHPEKSHAAGLHLLKQFVERTA